MNEWGQQIWSCVFGRSKISMCFAEMKGQHSWVYRAWGYIPTRRISLSTVHDVKYPLRGPSETVTTGSDLSTLKHTVSIEGWMLHIATQDLPLFSLDLPYSYISQNAKIQHALCKNTTGMLITPMLYSFTTAAAIYMQALSNTI